VTPIVDDEEAAIQLAYGSQQEKSKSYRDAVVDPASRKLSALTKEAFEMQPPTLQQPQHTAQGPQQGKRERRRCHPSKW
jgi:hypothetical protein